MEESPAPSQPHKPLPDPATVTALEFPVAPDFVSRPPVIQLQAMLQRIEESLAWRNQRPGEAERRLAEKIPVEFVLQPGKD